jgi:NADH pyrophosphatase NudC (nudix superfamily)
MAWSDYKICDLCGDAKVFYDANILDERYCATWGEPSDYDPIGLKAICGKCNKTHEVVIAPRATLASIKGESQNGQ